MRYPLRILRPCVEADQRPPYVGGGKRRKHRWRQTRLPRHLAAFYAGTMWFPADTLSLGYDQRYNSDSSLLPPSPRVPETTGTARGYARPRSSTMSWSRGEWGRAGTGDVFRDRATESFAPMPEGYRPRAPAGDCRGAGRAPGA